MSKIWWKFIVKKNWWSSGVNVPTALVSKVSMVLPDRIKILISIIQFD